MHFTFSVTFLGAGIFLMQATLAAGQSDPGGAVNTTPLQPGLTDRNTGEGWLVSHNLQSDHSEVPCGAHGDPGKHCARGTGDPSATASSLSSTASVTARDVRTSSAAFVAPATAAPGDAATAPVETTPSSSLTSQPTTFSTLASASTAANSGSSSSTGQPGNAAAAGPPSNGSTITATPTASSATLLADEAVAHTLCSDHPQRTDLP